MSEHQRRALVRLLGDEVSRCADWDQLLVFARHWLYEHRLLIVHDRAIRTLIAAALVHLEAQTAGQIRAEVQPGALERWCQTVAQPHATGQTRQSWLRGPPAKHSTRQISEVLERIDWLYGQEVHKSLGQLPDLLVRRYALWRVNLVERRATIWMRTVSRRDDHARDLIVAGHLYPAGGPSLGLGTPTFFGVA